MKISIALFLLALTSLGLRAQHCFPDYLEITSQTQVDEFAINYPECTIIEGDLYVCCVGNLEGLAQLKVVKGDIHIQEGWLEDLDGLQSLDSVYGNIFISSNLQLIQLRALDDIQFIGGTMSVSNNVSLTTLPVFTTLKEIGGLRIYFNSKINSLAGLASLTYIKGSLSLDYMHLVPDLNGLHNIDSIGEYLAIGEMDSLIDLNGLNSLQRTGSGLFITGNESLITLQGIENLVSINHSLNIIGNKSLTSIAALTAGVKDTLYSLKIYNNSVLEACNHPIICEWLPKLSEFPRIRDNAPGCNSIFEIYASCGTTVICFSQLQFRNQDEIDMFPVLFPNCTEISGDLIINGSGAAIRNLAGLQNITAVHGRYEISFTDITNLADLALLTKAGTLYLQGNDSLISLLAIENIDSIGTLSISDNDRLKSLPTFKNLERLDGLGISFNDSLVDLSGFHNLEVITGDLSLSDINSLDGLIALDTVYGGIAIIGTDMLPDLSGLQTIQYAGSLNLQNNNNLQSLSGLSMSSIPYLLYIANNDRLKDLAGLEVLGSVGSIGIYDNDSLVTCEALTGITTLTGFLSIKANPQLSTLRGLDSLVKIHRYIEIVGNDVLEDIQALNNFDPGQTDTTSYEFDLRMYGNPLLSACSLDPICQLINSPGAVTEVYSNGPGCYSEAEVLSSCIVSIVDAKEKPAFEVFPNPSSGEIHLEVTEPGSWQTIRIFDCMGHMAKQSAFQPVMTIAELPMGLYSIAIYDAKGNYALRNIMVAK